MSVAHHKGRRRTTNDEGRTLVVRRSSLVNVFKEYNMKEIAINWDELAMAFDSSSGEMSHYLDVETGEVLIVGYETRRQLEEVYEEHFNPDAPDTFSIDTALAETKIQDWEKEEVKVADFVEHHFGKRVIAIPGRASYEAYNEMQDFIATVPDDRLHNKLQLATQGRGAFRRFKDVLQRYPAEQQRWYAFRDNRLREQILEWLAEEGIEPVEDDE
jgi:hypothetical protein